MMKRQGIARLGAPDEPSPLPQHSIPTISHQSGASNMHTLAQTAQPPQLLGAAAMLAVSGSFVRSSGARPPTPVINYLKPGVQYVPPKPVPNQLPPRHKPLGSQSPSSSAPAVTPVTGVVTVVAPGAAPPAGVQFQRLKVEDALSYLDRVKYKFNTQPQVYNDFLDIMKEFKSQTIDTPGVITRVSNLFKGHPELIVGFNTFLPPGYKIEVQSNGQVSVSMPSPTSLGVAGIAAVGATPGTSTVLHLHHTPPQPQLVQILPVQSVVTPSVSSTAIVHNLSVAGPVVPPQSNTLHHISQAHQQIEAAHHSQGSAGTQNPGAHTPSAPPGQPVEFNHAIEYVNKIKSRFSRQPDKYKRFLEILHAYQRGHRDGKEPLCKQQTEQEVYAQVAKLFENQDDLLVEFGQFLPDAKAMPTKHHTPHQRCSVESDIEMPRYQHPTPAPSVSPPAPHHAHHAQLPKHSNIVPVSVVPSHLHLKRSPSFGASSQIGSGAPPCKKPRPSVVLGAALRDVSYAEAAKYGTMQEYNFFDRVRHALKSQEVYDNFLRCLLLFTNEVISSSELIQMTSQFFCRHPELQRWLHDFVGPMSPPHTPTNTTHTGYNSYNPTNTNSLLSYDRDRSADIGKSDRGLRYEALGPLGAQLRHDRPQGDAAMDVDLSTCKRLGTSYCALPRGSAESASRRCSGRTPLCKEVLNDTWVSFPTWSEDSTFVTCRKTQYEEYIYRCEDERFELDVVIETNAATIRVLEGVQKKLTRMCAEDANKYRLDDCLGGTSPTIHQRALRRIYGDKVAVDIIAGLKKNPVVAVPVVLRRLKAKEEEWREAQKGFNKQWREQNEKYYLKSLDHQGINFKQNDVKAMRSKALFNEVETAYAATITGPHVTVDYNTRNRQEAIKIVRDAAELLIHHARRQTAIQKAEKRRIKQLLRQFLPDLFNHPRQPLSDDERDDEEKEEPVSPDSPAQDDNSGDNSNIKKENQEQSSESDNASEKSARNNNKNNKENTPKNNNMSDSTKDNIGLALKRSSSNEDSQHSMKMDIKTETDPEEDSKEVPPNESRFVCSTSWYLFLRLHGLLCQRLCAARIAAAQLAEHSDARPHPSVALALRLKPNNLPAEVTSPAEYYTALLELVKGVLDGNTDSAAYEDAAREMLGIKAYPAYTLDKLVTYAVRQLQHCVSEPWSWRAVEMASRGGMRGAGATYVRRATRYLRQGHTAFLVKVYGGSECRVAFSLLENVNDGRASPPNESCRLSPTGQSRMGHSNGEAVSRVAAWSLYSERYVRPDLVGVANKPVFLRRNARRSGGGGGATTARAAALHPAPLHARRKPPRAVDTSECTLSANLRLIASRPHHLHRQGALKKARESHPRLHAARKAAFHEWLRSTGHQA